MTCSLIGRKCGMTRIFTQEGASIPVSVISVEPNTITQVKTKELDGYDGIQVTTGTQRVSRHTKPLAGLFKKIGVQPGRGLWEIEVDSSLEKKALSVGKALDLGIFKEGQKVDVTGITIGKGFAGTVKRHNFKIKDATHGNSLSHRTPGSIGQNQTPGRVFKGKKMSGHMGNKRRTIQNLEIIRVDKGRNLLLIKGAIPGSKGGDLIVHSAVKAKNVADSSSQVKAKG